MPRTKISEFSSTPASNTDIDSINIAENCAPSGINDAIRELMAQLKDFQTGAVGDSFNGPVGTTTAAAGAFTTLSASGAVTLSGGTANGVAYLNGSKVVTSGSALVFDGTNFAVGNNAANHKILAYTPGVNAGYIQVANGSTGVASTAGLRLGVNSAGVGELYSPTAAISYIDNAEQMRLTSTGLGIGTSSPTEKLQANGALRITAGVNNVNGNNGAFVAYESGGVTNIHSFNSSGGSIAFNTNASGGNTTERMRLDSSGNLGLGVTPSAWTSAYKAFDFGGYGNLFSNSTDKEVALTYNAAVVSGTGWTYKNTNQASLYNQQNGKHIWQTAASGTAGTSISWTTPMTLDASGNLGVGTTSPFNPGSTAQKSFELSGTSYATIYTSASSATVRGQFGADAVGSTVGIGARTNHPLTFATNDTERVRIDSSGNLLVGTTTAYAKFASKAASGQASGWFGVATNGDAGIFFANASNTTVGSITVNSSTTAYNTSSDYRLKNTITPMTGALAKVALLKPCTYKWNVDGSDGQGFIAHELQAIIPDAVVGEKDAVDENGNIKAQGIDTSFLVATLTAAIQEQQAIIESLKARLDAANL